MTDGEKEQNQKETGTKKVETNSKPMTVEERLARLEAFFFNTKGDKK